MQNNKSSKRILFIAPDPGAGGSTKAIIPVLIDLKQRGYDILVVISSEGYFSKRLSELGINYNINRYIQLNVWRQIKDARGMLLFFPRMLKLITFSILGYSRMLKDVRKFKPDIIYSNSSLVLYGYLAAKKLKIPHIWHVHEYGYKDFGLIFFPSNKTKLRFLQSTPSISITKEIYEYFNLRNSGIMIYNGIIDHETLNESINKKESNKSNYFLFVGSINQTKGVTDLIKAFCEYCDKGGSLNLVLCGNVESQYKEYLLRLAENVQDINNRIQFVGQVNNVYDYMRNARAIVVPSKYEAFGLVTSEAMFNRCLIIGRDTGGTKEQLDLGAEQTGEEIGLRFNTTEELASLLYLVEKMKYEDRSPYLERAYKTAINNFSLEHYIKSVRNYIDLVIEKRGM